MTYSPFTNDLHNLTADDLTTLRHVTEGWYVEYKREVPATTSIAKSVSAFANTYGGWLFYGVDEKAKEDAVAGAFPGIARADVDPALQRIRQAIAMLTNPSPHFDIKAVWGSVGHPELAEERAVICIQVPWSASAPHVHRSGMIYRRVADGSEPKPEADRALLDQLFRRSDKIREDYATWLNNDPKLSKGEGDEPWLRIMLVADLWQDRNLRVQMDIDEVREIMGTMRGVVGSLPFDTVYTASDGFIGRQLNGNDPFRHGLVWNLRPNLCSDIIIPLPWAKPNMIEALPEVFVGYSNIHKYTDILKGQGHKNPRVVDLNYIFQTLIGVVEIQRRLLKRAGWAHGYHAKTRLLSVWRTVPFIDVESVLDGFAKHGVPMCLDGVATSPSGSTPETFVPVGPFEEVDSESAKIFVAAWALFAPIARAYGIPTGFEKADDEAGVAYLADLHLAGERAMNVQQLRRERNANI